MARPENRFLTLLNSPRDRPLIIAHRGDSFHAPENTLEAARLGRKAGADAWELDVQLTRDAVPIVIHDESLLRTTDVAVRFAGDARGRDGFRVSDFAFDEVRSLDAGSWFVADAGGPRSARDFGTLDRLDPAHVEGFRSGLVRIPTLEEALLFTREQDWLVNVEIKSFPERPAGIVARVLEVVAATGTSDRVLISSFDHDDVVAADQPGRRHALGILLATPIHRLPEYAVDVVGADTVHVSTEVVGAESVAYRRTGDASELRRDIIKALEARGIPTLVYTVNHQAAESSSVSSARSESLGCSRTIREDDGHSDRCSKSTLRRRSPSIAGWPWQELAELFDRLRRCLEAARIDAGRAAKDPALDPGAFAEPAVQVLDLAHRRRECGRRLTRGHLLAEQEQPPSQPADQFGKRRACHGRALLDPSLARNASRATTARSAWASSRRSTPAASLGTGRSAITRDRSKRSEMALIRWRAERQRSIRTGVVAT